MKRYIMLVLVFLTFSSCKEQENTLKSTDDNKTKNGLIGFEFDSIGIYHNLIMDEFISNSSAFDNACDSISFMNTFFEELSSAYCTIGYDTPSSNCDSISRVNTETVWNELMSGPNYPSYFEETVAFNKLDSLMDKILNFSSTDIDSLSEEIRNWTIEVWSSSSYTTNDKDRLLKAGSVTYYSLNYWFAVHNNPNSPWHYALSCNKSKSYNHVMVPQWVEDVCAITAADGMGSAFGLIGAVTGSATCATWIYWDDVSDFLGDAWETLTGWLW